MSNCMVSPPLACKKYSSANHCADSVLPQVFAITFLPVLVISCIWWVQAQAKKQPLNIGINVLKSKFV